MELPEGKFEFWLFVSSDAELTDALDELLEVDLAVAVLVKDFYHPLWKIVFYILITLPSQCNISVSDFNQQYLQEMCNWHTHKKTTVLQIHNCRLTIQSAN